ncbi:MAG: PIG-L deacetylase family protein [Acidimicrobiales bacterium]
MSRPRAGAGVGPAGAAAAAAGPAAAGAAAAARERAPGHLVEETPARVLAVYAHPDDADVSCGGTLARWAAAGAEVHVAVVTSGDKGSSDPGADPADLVTRRAGEMAEAARVLGLVARHLLGHADGEVENDCALRQELVGLVRRVRPDVVVCPDPEAVLFGQDYVNHRDHRVVGWATLDAVAPAAALPLYFPGAGPPHQVATLYLSGTFEPDSWVDVSATIEQKARAVLCHRSQIGEAPEWMEEAVRRRAAEAGRRAGAAYAEGFRRLRLGG